MTDPIETPLLDFLADRVRQGIRPVWLTLEGVRELLAEVELIRGRRAAITAMRQANLKRARDAKPKRSEVNG